MYYPFKEFYFLRSGPSNVQYHLLFDSLHGSASQAHCRERVLDTLYATHPCPRWFFLKSLSTGQGYVVFAPPNTGFPPKHYCWHTPVPACITEANRVVLLASVYFSSPSGLTGKTPSPRPAFCLTFLFLFSRLQFSSPPIMLKSSDTQMIQNGAKLLTVAKKAQTS